MSQQTLTARARKARMAVKAGLLQKIPGRGYRVPSRSSPYHHIVLFRWFKRDGESGYRVTCHYEHGGGQHRCPGNQRYICWHVLAAFMAAAGGKVAFFENLALAQHYSHLGGKLVKVKSGDGSGFVYAVWRKHDE